MKKPLLLLAAALIALAFSACGGGDSSSSSSGERPAEASAETAAGEESGIPTSEQGYPLMDDGVFDERVRYAADPEGKLAFFISEASASPGRIAFQFVNPQSVPHDVALEAADGETIGKTETISEGATTAHFTVKPGVYVLYCTVPGHRQAGMVGHLTVK